MAAPTAFATKRFSIQPSPSRATSLPMKTQPSLPRLAASYAFGIARNHAFVDGNKRTALVVSEGFLRSKWLKIVSPRKKIYFTFLHLADGSLSEEELTAWFTKHAVPCKLEPAFQESFPPGSSKDVVFCDSLGTCAFECPDLLEGHRACQRGLNRNLLPAHYVTTQGFVRLNTDFTTSGIPII